MGVCIEQALLGGRRVYFVCTVDFVDIWSVIYIY